MTDLVTIVDAGVDWITCTFADGKIPLRDRLSVQRIFEDEVRAGNEETAWFQSGYVGRHCGGVEFGERHDGFCLRLHGPTAHEHWNRFAESASNVSRLDLQVTVKKEGGPTRSIANCYRQARRYYKGNGNAPALSMFRTSAGGSTFYIGKRASDVYVRIYDKEAESQLDHYKDCVRYEVELKNERAFLTCRSLASSPTPEAAVLAIVWTYIRDRGIRPPWHIKDRASNRCSYSSSNAQKRLQWLERSVRPAVRDLIESGMMVQALDALGLSAMLGRECGPVIEFESKVKEG